MIGSSYVKIPFRSSTNLNIENDDKSFFIWSILAKLHPKAESKNGHPTRVSNYRQNFDELNIQGFCFTNEFKCTDTHKFEKLDNLPINIFELSLYQEIFGSRN